MQGTDWNVGHVPPMFGVIVHRAWTRTTDSSDPFPPQKHPTARSASQVVGELTLKGLQEPSSHAQLGQGKIEVRVEEIAQRFAREAQKDLGILV